MKTPDTLRENEPTVYKYKSFLSNNGYVSDRFGFNSMARTLHKHRQLATASRVTVRLSHGLSVCAWSVSVWYVFVLM